MLTVPTEDDTVQCHTEKEDEYRKLIESVKGICIRAAMGEKSICSQVTGFCLGKIRV